MFYEFVKAFIFVFIAELGDKTQIMLMSLACRYTKAQVLSGIFLGVALNHGLAIIIGSYLSNLIHTDLLHIFIGSIFIIFGFLSFVDENEEESNKKPYKCGPTLTVALTFFLGELGDKTQLTAMTLSMDSEYPFIILAGSVAGMLLIGLFGIIIGNELTKRVPSYIIKIVSGSIFIIFGITKLFEVADIFVNNFNYQGILISMIGIIAFFQISKLISNRT